MNAFLMSGHGRAAVLTCCALCQAAAGPLDNSGVVGRLIGQLSSAAAQREAPDPQNEHPSNMPVAAPFAVTIRQGGMQAPLAASKREARMVASSAESFGEVIKTELIAAAVRMSVQSAQEQMYKALTGQLSRVAAQAPIAGSRIIGRIAERMMARMNKQRAFEFDYLPGVNSSAELSVNSPVEFVIAASNAFSVMKPVLLRADVLDKDAIRVIAARKIELTQKETSGFDRKLINVEKKLAAAQIHKNADGTFGLQTAGPLDAGEYVLAFQTGDDSAFALLDQVYAFRVSK